MKKTEGKSFTIDAKGKSLGRVATEAAKILLGKDTASFEKHIPSANFVKIVNGAGLSVRPLKKTTKMYKRYSGYPGGLTEESFEHLSKRKGYKAVIENAVYGMLPRTRHRDNLMKQLKVEE